jgi:putative endopeptidase
MKMKKLIPIMAFASAAITVGAQTPLKSGIDLSNMDLTMKPGADFYQYACGGWMKKNPLPAAYARFGSFDQLQQNNSKRINSILTELQKGSFANGTIEQKLGDFYKLAMDSVRRNKEGVAPVMPIIREIEKAKTIAQLEAIQLKYEPYGGIGDVVPASFDADQKNASMNILNIYQGGITLGEKEYYLDNDSATAGIREAYKKHIVTMFRLFGFSDKVAQQKMVDIMNIETSLAKVMKSNTELRDVEANYHKIKYSEFSSKYPHIQIDKLMQALGVKAADYQTLVIGQPEFLAGADKIIAAFTPAQKKAYMEWDVINSSASYLSDKVSADHFDFFGKTMQGRKEDYPRWKKSTSQVESKMGEALGRIYVKRYFPATSKARMEQLVKNLQVSLGERIQAQTWMSDTTKAAALDKLHNFYVKIGYPNKWKDLSKLTINPSKSYYANVLECNKFLTEWYISHKAGKPTDKDEWLMTPQTVNAYYNPTTNEICFPAGILQPPFFDPSADDAFNYGAIGVVIGHEMTHGFDDQGRHYDKKGNMTDWWTASDAKNFDSRTGKYADFFSAIKVLPDLNSNGKLTLGENLADHGGLEVSFNAYKNATKNAPLKDFDGLTPDQRFFLAYAGVWASNITEKEIRNRVKSDPHSLGMWRVNGALPHIEAWYKAFNINEADKMFIPIDKRLSLW